MTIYQPFELGWIAGLDAVDPRCCPFEKMTAEWKEWQSAHGKAVEYRLAYTATLLKDEHHFS